jgi:hypothetical protein
MAAFPPPEYYLSEESIVAAIAQQSMFNLLWVDEGDKADFWLLTDEPFDRSRFSRKCKEDVDGLSIKVSAPEDTILAKLRWSKLAGGSQKQFTDALRVYEVQKQVLDHAYLNVWAAALSVQDSWQLLQAQAKLV